MSTYIIVVTVAAGALLVALLVALKRRTPRHRHTWRDVGTTAVGWTLMRCHCGDTEIR